MPPHAQRWYDAIRVNDAGFVRSAIARKRAVFSHEDKDRNGVLHWAAATADAGEILDLLLTAPGRPAHALDRLNNQNASPLGVAVQADLPAHVQRLLVAGADPNKRQRLMSGLPSPSALHHARSAAVVRLLVQAGAELEPVNLAGQTPLLSMASHGRVVVFDAMLEAGANLRATVSGDGGLSNGNALHLAVLGPAQAPMIERLLQLGFSLTDQDRSGRTPMNHARDMAQKFGRAENLAVLERWVLRDGSAPVGTAESRPTGRDRHRL